MVRKYVIGNPIETDSVVESISPESGALPYFNAYKEQESLTLNMDKSARVYGLGETVRGINKRGFLYVSNNSDDPFHLEEKVSLYASQNFFLYLGKDMAFGMYVDTPGKVSFDIGFSDINVFSIIFEDFDADIYVIDGESMVDIVRQFRKIIGKSYVPPKWAFGFGQCRWSYMSSKEVKEVADNYDDLDMPIDSI
jgi:alpha-glucosidase